MVKSLRFPEAAAAVSRIVGVPHDAIFFGIENGSILVQWLQATPCTDAQRQAVIEAVHANVPSQYQGYQVSIV